MVLFCHSLSAELPSGCPNKPIATSLAESQSLDTLNTLRPRRNEQHFVDDIFKCIFCNKIDWISIKISLKFVPKGPNNNIPALVQIMAWRRSGDKPLSEPMMVSLQMHICITRPQWVKLRFFQILNSNSRDISFHSYLHHQNMITTKFHTQFSHRIEIPWMCCN